MTHTTAALAMLANHRMTVTYATEHVSDVTYAVERSTQLIYRADVVCRDCDRRVSLHGQAAARPDLIRAAGNHTITVGSE